MSTWISLVEHHSGAETWVNFDNVAYFREVMCNKDNRCEFWYTSIVFCAKGDYGLSIEVRNRVDEIKTKLALIEAAAKGTP